MLSVNRINNAENIYTNQNKKISFKSKFIPNKAIKDAFECASVELKWGDFSRSEKARWFTGIVDTLLNDGKDDFISITRNSLGSTIIINGKKAYYYPEYPADDGFVDGGRVINAIVNYFGTMKNITDPTKLTKDEFKVIKPALDNLNSDLNADDAIRNPQILHNLETHYANVNATLYEYTYNILEKLKTKIFKK